MPLKKYINGSWVDTSYKRYETGTDAVTNLPVTILTDGQPVTSWTMKGNTTTSGTPSPSSPVTISGVGEETANLFNYETVTAGRAINDGTGGTIAKTGYNASAYINIEGFSKISLLDTQSNRWGAFYDENKTYISGFNGYGTRTVPQNAVYVRVTVPDDYLTTFMLNGGETLLPFEPYGKYKISILKGSQALTPIYVSQELYKLGDYSDSINSSGTATYYIVKKVLDGTETWTYVAAQSGGEYYFRTKLGNYGYVVSDLAISTHYSWTNITSSTSEMGIDSINSETANLGGIAIRDTNYANATAFAAYIAQQYANGTPVVVYYVLATPTTESVTAPSIPTTGGEVTLDVDTTVKPSELDLTYHGWHEHQPLKYNNGSWS